MININLKKIILIYLFLVLPIIDMLNGYLVINGILDAGGIASPSQLGRMIAFIFLLIYIYKEKLNIKYLLVFSVFILTVEIASALFYQSIIGTIIGITTSYKLIYLFSLLMVSSSFIKNNSDFLFFFNMLELNLFIISISIIFSFVTGVGNSTYGWGLGTKGFFASGNSLGIYIGVMSLLYLSHYKNNLISTVKLYLFLLVPFSLFLLSSKTALILGFILLFYWLITTNLRVLILPLFLLFSVIYYNELLKLILLVSEVVISRYENSPDLFSFIASGRNESIAHAISIFEAQDISIFRYLFGMGSFVSYQNFSSINLAYNTLEADIFDVFFMYGFLGCLIYIYMFYYIYKSTKKHKVLLFTLILLFLHSLFAGHVIFNGMSSLALMSILIIVNSQRKNHYVKINN